MCGSRGDSSPEIKSIALENIEDYPEGNSTLQDYIDVEVQRVTVKNLDQVNALIDSLTVENIRFLWTEGVRF